MRLSKMIAKGIRNPSKAVRFLADRGRRRVQVARRQARTSLAVRGVPEQTSLLDDLRDDDEWLLVVLDACRFREFAALAPIVFEGEICKFATAGHDTFEYARLCWPDYYPGVTYVSAAVPINSIRLQFDDEFEKLYEGYHPADHLGTIIDVWESHWDPHLGIVPPNHVTEVAMDYQDRPRVVAHYFQPHAPYIGTERELGHIANESAKPVGGEPVDAPLWRKIKHGEIGLDRLDELYRSNLEFVLAETAKLVEAAPHDRIVIMGDHGEALGEYGIYAHPRVEHPYIRTAPWMEVTGLQDGWENAVETPNQSNSNADSPVRNSVTVKNRLADLGYI